MFVAYWLVVLCLAAIVLYFHGELSRARKESRRLFLTLEKIYGYGQMPLLEFAANDSEKLKAYRHALEIQTAIARRAIGK